jgi:cytochrome c-type biogenesis protein CcmH/NrfF
MIRSLMASAAALLVAAAPSAAQKPPASGETMAVHPEAKAAIDRIKSPYCPGMMLEVCTSSGGAMLRDSAQSWAEQGLPADSIVERIISAYGEEYRAEPLHSGTGLWAWILPPGALLLGLGGVGVVLARRRRMQPSSGAEAVPVDPEDEARLKAAIREMEEEEEPVF